LITEGVPSGNPLAETSSVPQDNKGEQRGFSSSKLSVLRKHAYFADLQPDAFDQLCR